MFEKIMEAMNLGDDDEEDYVDEVPSFGSKKRETVEEQPSRSSKPANSGFEKQRPVSRMNNKQKKNNGAGPMEIVAIKPTSFDDAREIAETLLADRAVILNMDGLDLGVAQRIIDFICGACFAIEGNLQKVSTYIFIITPPGVELSGDMQGLVDAFDFSGLQTGF